MRWVGYVARIGEERTMYKVLVGTPERKHHSEDRGVERSRMDLREIGRGMWSGLSWLRIGRGGGLL
jgi:hypothetical protein